MLKYLKVLLHELRDERFLTQYYPSCANLLAKFVNVILCQTSQQLPPTIWATITWHAAQVTYSWVKTSRPLEDWVRIIFFVLLWTCLGETSYFQSVTCRAHLT